MNNFMICIENKSCPLLTKEGMKGRINKQDLHSLLLKQLRYIMSTVNCQLPT